MNDKIKEILLEILKVEKDDFDEQTNLRDMGLNSLKAVLLVVKLEEMFCFEMDNEDLMFKNLKTVEDIKKLVIKYTGDDIGI